MYSLKREASVEEFFYSSKNYMFVLSDEGHIKQVNPSFAKALQTEKIQLEKGNLKQFIHPADWELTSHLLAAYLENIEIETPYEVRVVTGRQKVKWISITSISVSPAKDLYVIAHDITEIKRLQLENNDIRNKLFQIIDLVPHPIFLKDDKGRYTLANQAQASLFSVTKEKLIGKDDSYFIRKNAELKSIRDSDLRVIEKRESISLPEQIITRLDGTTRILHTIKIPFQGTLEEKISILGVSIDLTEMKKVEQELRITNFELDSFVYRSSHDLRAPLCSLTGLLNLMLKETDQALINTCIYEAIKSVKKLDSFIADLTNLSRNSRLESKPQKIDFNQLIKDCVDDLKFMDNAEKVNYDIRVEHNGHDDFYSDEDRLKIILMNLISNAIKYQKADQDAPQIIIHIQTGTQTSIIVSDNGVGIENIYQDKVFDMFFRASENSFGSGLGLYIVRQIVDRLKGEISLKSSFGVGTTIEIKLPDLLRV